MEYNSCGVIYMEKTSSNIIITTGADRAKLLGSRIIEMEKQAVNAVTEEIARIKANGHPVALYDAELKKPYSEYPDGRREYDIENMKSSNM